MAHTDDNETLWLKKTLKELSADLTILETAMKEILEVSENGDGGNDIGKVEFMARRALQEVSMDTEFEQARLRILNKL